MKKFGVHKQFLHVGNEHVQTLLHLARRACPQLTLQQLSSQAFLQPHQSQLHQSKKGHPEVAGYQTTSNYCHLSHLPSLKQISCIALFCWRPFENFLNLPTRSSLQIFLAALRHSKAVYCRSRVCEEEGLLHGVF